MAQKKTLEILPETASESIVVVPTSATSLDGRAKKFAVRDDTGRALISADAEAKTASLAGLVTADVTAQTVAVTVPFIVKSMTETARDALTAVAGMVIFNTTRTRFDGYNGTDWIAMNIE